ncbi:aminopeptidase N [Rhodococcoides corynebacterioides]|uniref:Aminopeptidase N n=1 Tax=Rhodococcoides corynebacterioides TaxID=53972 RepID=A0ABS7P5U5_9NOCA|nr:aminopeptidase N [Rhodococcus corynebacterioides]MBY6367787.1 aminopeptidase N [Rhodococcus corynebacterioides]MBY6408268.1 aminopeptidase N [Rhodococcus corynebacterioides]
MSTANLTRSETAHRARVVTVSAYDVALDLSGALTDGEFGVVATIALAASSPETWLDFLGAGVDRVEIDGRETEVEYDGARIALRGLTGASTVRVHGRGLYSRTGEGLHRFVDPADGETYLYTQYEPADARRVFPCFEQPDLKAPFTFRVTAPSEWLVLSNERLERTDGDTRVFAPTQPISTYITAVVAGPYHRVEGRSVQHDLIIDLGVHCRKSLAQYLDADAILDVTRAGLDFFHDAFDYEYPFGKYDQVFVPEYNLGAMENPGCVTFTESYVFRSAATRSQYARRANTILHEMAHMWFGDLVTMRWWDDLWLKESFADYMGSYASVAATEFTDAWVAFAQRRKAWAYSQDQLPTTHPIVADIVDLEAAKLNFDGITYAKGASVLKQLAAFVGEYEFLDGARLYFRRHAYGNTTLTDLLAALQDSSLRDLEAWAAAWLQTTGPSTLTVDRARGVIVQTDPRPQRLDVAVLAPNADGELVDDAPQEVHLTGAETSVDLAAAGDGTVVLLNDGDHTYAKVRLDAASVAVVESSLDRIPDDLRRSLVWSSLWNATRDAEYRPSRFVDLARRFAPREPHEGILASVLADTAVAVERYVADRDAVRSAWADTAYEQLVAADAGSDHQLEWWRAWSAAAVHTDRAAQLRDLLSGRTSIDGLVLDAEQRWALWFALAARGDATVAELDAVLDSDRTGAGEVAHTAAVAALPDGAARVWTALTEESPSNEKVGALVRGFTAGERSRVAAYDAPYYAMLEDVWRDRSIEIARRLVVGLFPPADTTDDADRWLAEHPDAPAALRRQVIEQRDHLARALRARAADAE